MAILTVKSGPRRRRRGEANTFRLPTGEAIRRLLKRMFAAQRKLVRKLVRALTGRAGSRGGEAFLPDVDFDPPLRLGQLDYAKRFTPLLEAIWDDAGRSLMTRVGLDPDEWRVTDPNLRAKIEQAAYDFCDATNATTSRDLNTALATLRREMIAGQAERGDTLDELTARVNRVFDGAETWRARRIAASEASRAVHAAELESAIQSGVVAGFEWLASGDACDLCLRVRDEVGRVRLGEAFAVVGNHPVYSTVRHPPLHPGCQCSVTTVAVPAYGGPVDPKWGSPLIHAGAKPSPAAPAEAKPSSSPLPSFGRSAAKVKVPTGEARRTAIRSMRGVLGKSVTRRQVASILGAPDDATVHLSGGGPSLLGFRVESPDLKEFHGTIERFQGETVLRINSLEVLKGRREGGVAVRIHGRMVEWSSRHRLARLELLAARDDEPDGDGDRKKVGYLVWPIFGYDGPLPAPLLEEARSLWPGVSRVQDVLTAPGGKDWWHGRGTSFEANFNLASGSVDQERWSWYWDERNQRKKAMADGKKGDQKYGPNELGLSDEEIDEGLDSLRRFAEHRARRQVAAQPSNRTPKEPAPNDSTREGRDG